MKLKKLLQKINNLPIPKWLKDIVNELLTDKRLRLIILIIAILLIVSITIVTAFLIVIISIFSGMCGNKIINTYISPSNDYKVVIFERNCGATTGFTTQISVLKNDAELGNEGGNIFIADGHPDDNDIEILWLNDDNVSISYHNVLKIFEMNNHIDYVKIQYHVKNLD